MSSENIVNESSNNVSDISEEILDPSYIINSWDDLDLNRNILRGIYAYGFEKPSPIQQKAIKPIINGKDVIAQAQSGTGKTATFSIGALSIIDMDKNKTQVLILSPTRELATQTSKVITAIGSLMENSKKETLRVQTIFGGSAFEENTGFVNKNTPHIICGCPGRVYDMVRREKISMKNIKLIILDEADEMLSSTFKEQVYNIFQYLNNDTQVALFSATLPVDIFPVINKIMRDPVKIIVKAEMLTLEGIGQYFIAVDDDKQKYDTLKNIFSFISMSQCIIYCNSVKRVSDLYDAMLEDGFPVCCIHSSMDPSSRATAFSQFRNGSSRVLISSNVTSRGIDIQQVGIVINFDLPKCVHNYLHRIGRSGRWGRKGTGINFITRRDIGKMREIESHYSTQIQEMPADLAFLS
jgi:translation initiation factor 4A